MEKLFKLQLYFFMLLLVLWNVFTPVLEGADEVGHFCHADYIAQRAKLPNLKNLDGCFLWHPPLYYLVLTPIVKLFDTPQFQKSDYPTNPNFEKLREGQYSQFTHSKNELLLRWNKNQILIHTLRLISSIYAVIIFIITAKIAKIVFKKSPLSNLSLLIFYNPMFLHIFSTLTNVTLITLIATVLIAVDFLFVEKRNLFIKRPKSLKIYFLEGLLAGLGFITKITILSLVFAKAFLFINSQMRFSLKESTAKIMFVILGFLTAAGWYMMRSYNLYGNFLERDVIAQLPEQYVHTEFVEEIGLINYVNSLFLTLFRTFWSGFGAVTINFPQVVNVILLLATFLLTFSLYKNRKFLNYHLKISLYYVISIFLALILANTKLRAMHAKDLFLAYLPLALLFSFSLAKCAQTFKKNKIDLKVQSLFVVPAVYFYAQQEIVKMVKFILAQLNLVGFYNADFDVSIATVLVLLLKTSAVIVLFLLVKRALANIPLSINSIKLYSLILFTVNIIILSVSTYLFYFRF